MYIGLSKNSKRRYNGHLSASFNPKNKDYNSSIHKAIRKYGIENFEFNILEEDIETPDLLKEREIYWIKFYNTYKNREHYNETPGGDNVGEKSVHLGEEHGMAKLTEEDVKFCRKCYKDGLRSKDIYNKYYKDKINYGGF